MRLGEELSPPGRYAVGANMALLTRLRNAHAAHLAFEQRRVCVIGSVYVFLGPKLAYGLITR